jgi:hypothetical protein
MALKDHAQDLGDKLERAEAGWGDPSSVELDRRELIWNNPRQPDAESGLFASQ